MRQSESGCPFCGASLALAERSARPQPTQRLGRAATFAFGAAMATSVAACGGGGTPGTDSGIAPAYGAPSDSGPVADTGAAVDAAPADDAGQDAGMLAMYGGPPQDAGQAADTGGPAPAYGAPAGDGGTV